MTGPEHYIKAEALIRGAARYAERTEAKDLTAEELRDLKDSVTSSLAAAQVHATLALAAATAEHSESAMFWRKDGAL